MKKIKDHLFWKAKHAGFKARSIYKLIEIDEKHRLIKKDQKIIELGAHPGSWTKLITEKIGSGGALYSFDLSPLEMNLPPQATYYQEDIYNFDFGSLIIENGRFDLLLSDLAPKTTGIKWVDQEASYNLTYKAALLAQKTLKNNASALIKTFQGPRTNEIVDFLKICFKKVIIIKPISSRKESFEMFLLALTLNSKKINLTE
ncbi:MAG: RlmE family RNA methyltransferase [SAR324 cluster bacterium]|nr:RlmE family RNA methyltransferase [SAR324 cluster bacterium]